MSQSTTSIVAPHEHEDTPTDDAPRTRTSKAKRSVKTKATNSRRSKASVSVAKDEADDSGHDTADDEPSFSKVSQSSATIAKAKKKKTSVASSIAVLSVSGDSDVPSASEPDMEPARVSSAKVAPRQTRRTMRGIVSEAHLAEIQGEEAPEPAKTKATRAKVPAKTNRATRAKTSASQNAISVDTSEHATSDSEATTASGPIAEHPAYAPVNEPATESENKDYPTPRAKMSHESVSYAAPAGTARTIRSARSPSTISEVAIMSPTSNHSQNSTLNSPTRSDADLEETLNEDQRDSGTAVRADRKDNAEGNAKMVKSSMGPVTGKPENEQDHRLEESTPLAETDEDEEMEVLASPDPGSRLASKPGNDILPPTYPVRPVRSLPKKTSPPRQTEVPHSHNDAPLSRSIPQSSAPASISIPQAVPTLKPNIFAHSTRPTVAPIFSRTQSALDALLAAPMPNFDSPDKHSTMYTSDSGTPPSSASVSEVATPPAPAIPSIALSSDAALLYSAPLSLNEGKLPLTEWIELLCRKEIARFEQESSRYLSEWDKQVISGRQEVSPTSSHRAGS